MLHVDELAPRLGVVGEALHERGVAVLAGVAAAHIRIDSEIGNRQVGFRHHASDTDFLDPHLPEAYHKKCFPST